MKKRRRKIEDLYYVVKDGKVISGFGSFYEAYMHALNRSCSENFLVKKHGDL